MPELPEVETIRRGLAETYLGRRIRSVSVTGVRSVRRHGPVDDFSDALAGQIVQSADRLGKYLLLRLTGDTVVVIHLGMSGQLLAASPAEPFAKHTHVVFTFAAGQVLVADQLRFVDPRTFGELFLSRVGQLERTVPELTHLGFDPLNDPVTARQLGRLLGQRRCQLKALLTDQRLVAGIGNIYSDEILFAAGLRPDRQSHTLAAGEVRLLQRAMVGILGAAIAAGGSSLADQQYRDLYGRAGRFQRHHRVYGREGQACLRCRSTIARRKGGGRSTFWCPGCQR
jgi:formamidopyrimidine-DNA glycosylase